MFGIGQPRRPSAIAFDMLGTVFPLEPLRDGLTRMGLPPGALEGWFAAGLRDAFALAAAGDFKPFEVVLEGALEQIGAEYGLESAAAARGSVLKQFAGLRPRADAREAFELAFAHGASVIALTNGSAVATKALLQAGGLDENVQHVVSAEDISQFKPRPQAYERAAKAARVPPRSLGLIAAHPWDVNGAKAAGLVTGFLNSDRAFPGYMRGPDVQGASLPDVVRAMLALPS